MSIIIRGWWVFLSLGLEHEEKQRSNRPAWGGQCNVTANRQEKWLLAGAVSTSSIWEHALHTGKGKSGKRWLEQMTGVALEGEPPLPNKAKRIPGSGIPIYREPKYEQVSQMCRERNGVKRWGRKVIDAYMKKLGLTVQKILAWSIK